MGNIGGRPNSRQENQTPFLRRAGLYIGVAFELPGTIIGGLLVGYYLDSYFGSSPWFLIALTALAFVGAFVRLVQWARYFAGERNGNRSKKDDSAG